MVPEEANVILIPSVELPVDVGKVRLNCVYSIPTFPIYWL
jgi:hypothetical protein